MLYRRCLFIMGIFLLTAVTACSSSVETIEISDTGWELGAVGLPVAELYDILSVQDMDMPTYNDCADAQNSGQPAKQCSLDLIFIPSPDYSDANALDFSAAVQQIILDVFGADSPLNRHTGYGQRFRPFSFYVTEFLYPDNAPASGGCSPGLPDEWVPATPNLADVELPAWDCNLALSTAGIELDVGFVVHTQQITDRNRYNLFTAEYNSYAAILHELSHAAFVMSDEAPSVLESGRFLTTVYPNVFSIQIPGQQALCESTCAEYGGQCVDIPRIDQDKKVIQEKSGYARCEVEGQDTNQNNLLYFNPQPNPGGNENWWNYDYYFEAVKRLDYIYRLCNQAKC